MTPLEWIIFISVVLGMLYPIGKRIRAALADDGKIDLEEAKEIVDEIAHVAEDLGKL